jgi:hypothetical protein
MQSVTRGAIFPLAMLLALGLSASAAAGACSAPRFCWAAARQRQLSTQSCRSCRRASSGANGGTIRLPIVLEFEPRSIVKKKENDDVPDYRDPDDIPESELRIALCGLNLLGDDPYLRMQALNLSIVDQFLMGLEYDTLQKLNDEESTPIPEATFLSAMSQMWIFAAYELLRTWRQRAKEVLKQVQSGGLAQKVEALERSAGKVHVAQQIRALQFRRALNDPDIGGKISDDLRAIHIPMSRLEHLRIGLAKHEVRGQRNSIAFAPGYGRINMWCGSLDYEIGSGNVVLDVVSRRDIADSLRGTTDHSSLPSEEHLKSFDTFMKGPRVPDRGGENSPFGRVII